jgi:hypothetical protein
MRKSMFASFAALVLGASLALTGCKVGDDGGGDTGGDDNPGTDEGDDEGNGPDAGEQAQPCPPSPADFKTDVMDVAMTACLGCHASGGIAGSTQLILDADDADSSLDSASTVAKKKNAAGVSVLLVKPTGGGSHAGGAPISNGSAQYQALELFVNQVNGTGGVCD